MRIIENPYIEHLESIFTGVPFLTTKQILEGLRVRFPETPDWALSVAVGKLKREGVIRKIDGKLFAYGSKGALLRISQMKLQTFFRALKESSTDLLDFRYLTPYGFQSSIWQELYLK